MLRMTGRRPVLMTRSRVVVRDPLMASSSRGCGEAAIRSRVRRPRGVKSGRRQFACPGIRHGFMFSTNSYGPVSLTSNPVNRTPLRSLWPRRGPEGVMAPLSSDQAQGDGAHWTRSVHHGKVLLRHSVAVRHHNRNAAPMKGPNPRSVARQALRGDPMRCLSGDLGSHKNAVPPPCREWLIEGSWVRVSHGRPVAVDAREVRPRASCEHWPSRVSGVRSVRPHSPPPSTTAAE